MILPDSDFFEAGQYLNRSMCLGGNFAVGTLLWATVEQSLYRRATSTRVLMHSLQYTQVRGPPLSA
jgi:hypothetical protein